MDRALSEDCLRKVLTFVSVKDCARGAGAASKHLRGVASTTNRLRFTEEYVLRPPQYTTTPGVAELRGVVHALATALGTRRWLTRTVQGSPALEAVIGAAVPPARLGITIHRIYQDEGRYRPQGQPGIETLEPYALYVASGIVDPDVTKYISGGRECSVSTGSWIQYDLPFQFKISAFSFGFSRCNAEHFKDWTFEAFDGEEWRQIYYNRYGPWPEARWDSNELAQPVMFGRLGDAGASSRFRIRLAESNLTERCMHVRGLELYGTIMPPWRID